MDDRQQQGPQSNTLVMTLPRRTLLVLCGPAGCGKSTLASNLVTTYHYLGLRATTSISSDHCRALICDDENNQAVNRDTFDLFHFIIHKRMLQHRFTIADSTALRADARHRLLGLVYRHNYTACLLIFNIPLELCIQRDQQRTRSVGPQVIAYHTDLLQQALQCAPQEGWHQVHVLTEKTTSVALEILPDPNESRESIRPPQ
jgi:predicted kinase